MASNFNQEAAWHMVCPHNVLKHYEAAKSHFGVIFEDFGKKAAFYIIFIFLATVKEPSL